MKKSGWLFIVFFSVSFLFMWQVVNPRLLYQNLQPVFFSGARFLQIHLQYPGGPTEYVANAVSQFFTLPALGAIVILLFIAAITWCLSIIFKRFNGGKPATLLSLIAAGLLVSLQSGYFVDFSYTLALLWPLMFAVIYLQFKNSIIFLRLIVFALFSVLLYYLAAAPFFLFVGLAILAEIFLVAERGWLRLLSSLFYAALAFFIPQLAHAIFLFSRPDMYTYLLPFSIHTPIPGLPLALYAFIPGAPLVLALVQNVSKSEKENAPVAFSLPQLVASIVVLLALVILMFVSVDKRHKVLLRIDYMAQTRDWQSLIQYAQEHSDVLHELITFHYDRALYHTGHLNDNLFDYPQVEGQNGLYRNFGRAFDMPYGIAALNLEMGNLNSAQMWGNEALAVEGESTRVLKLLALTHLLKQEYPAANVYFAKLKKALFTKKWIQHYQAFIEHPENMDDDPFLGAINKPENAESFLIRYGSTYAELKYLTETQPHNRMALEYCTAYCLLARRLDRFIELVPRLTEMTHDNLPRNVQEALVLIALSGSGENLDLKNVDIKRVYVDGLKKFGSILAKHDNNPQYAQAELQKSFGDTYWYYHLYHQAQELNP